MIRPSGSAGAVAEKDLAIAAVSGPNSLDPAQLVDGQQQFVWSSILDTLLAKENNTGELIPNAAESWEYNEDGTELTLTLREGMTFSTGDPVNADAVVANPSGTRTPADARFPIISPSDEFFPPTSSRSAIPNDENHFTFALTSSLLCALSRHRGHRGHWMTAGSGR